jgi:hypothetical protein
MTETKKFEHGNEPSSSATSKGCAMPKRAMLQAIGNQTSPTSQPTTLRFKQRLK